MALVWSQFVDEDGVAYGVEHISNKPRVVTTPHHHEIAAGNVTNHVTRRVLGYNSAITDTLADITELGVAVTPLPTSAITMEVDSTSVNDDGSPAGTGARTVEVHGLDANWDSKFETVTLNGTTAVALTGTWMRINNIHVLTAGPGGVAIGDITVQATGGGTVYNKIAAGGNMSLQGHFTVPDGKKAFITGWHPGVLTSTAATKARILLLATAGWNDRALLSRVYQIQGIVVLNNGTTFVPFTIPILLPARCDLKIAAQRVDGAGTVQATAAVELYYADE
jgi:hypothetical protein